MRLITWNCAMALTKKFEVLSGLGADVMVVQECSRKSIEQINSTTDFSGVWFGKNVNKGLGIICRSPWQISGSKDFGLMWAINVKVRGPMDIDLYAIWACAGNRYEDRYIRQVHLLLDQLEKTGVGENAALLGDFNSNVFWDTKYQVRGHSAAVKRLADLGLYSAYHRYFNEEQGKETQPTLCFMKKRHQLYHIDYIFLSRSLIEAMKIVSVGNFNDWIKHSDHVPLLVELAA